MRAATNHQQENGSHAWLSDDEEEMDEEDEHASDDPLYDPHVDDKDERLLHEGRQGRTTDAILSCPGCFTTLSVDCQAHESIHNRYRAMFVMNAVVDTSRIKAEQPKRKGGRGKSSLPEQNFGKGPKDTGDVSVVFHPVNCSVCGVEVGVMEAKDEIYHFIDCLASNA